MGSNNVEIRVLMLSFALLICAGWLMAGVFDQTGAIPESGSQSVFPDERINLFNGNVSFKHLDVHLAGPNGFDLKVWRFYNSKIRPEKYLGCDGTIGPYWSWVGLGWDMHMGYVTFESELWSSNVFIHLPDGGSETAYPSLDFTHHITKSYLKYDRNEHKLYFQDGTVWIFGEERNLDAWSDPFPRRCRVVTRIENPYGHHIDITYRGVDSRHIDTVTDSFGRIIYFDTIDRYDTTINPDDTTVYELYQIRVKDELGNQVAYQYDVRGINPDGTGQPMLFGYDPPEIPPTTFEYYEDYVSPGGIKYELKAINTGYGGRAEYTFKQQVFYYDAGLSLCTRVLDAKTVTYSSDPLDTATWTYHFPDYSSADPADRTMWVDGPENDTYARHHNIQSGDWAVGLLEKKWITENGDTEEISSETIEWTGYKITNDPQTIMNVYFGYVYAPLVFRKTVVTEGDADSVQEYWYGEQGSSGTRDLWPYGLPCDVVSYVNGVPKKAERFEYHFEGNTSFADRYMLSFKSSEEVYNIDPDPQNPGELTWLYEKKTTSDYFSNGALAQKRRCVSGDPDGPSGVYLTSDYTYTENGSFDYPGTDITITEDLPGDAGIVTRRYLYGTLAEVLQPATPDSPGGFVELTRTISEHNGAILTETNQHYGVKSYQYDDLGRMIGISMPAGFDDVSASWDINSLTITRGLQTGTRYWDGMGRDTGYAEVGDGVTLYYLKTLDADGRVIRETKGSTNTTHEYIYHYDAAGRMVQQTDPRGIDSWIEYTGNQKRITDADLKLTVLDFETFPGLVSTLTDANSILTQYSYDVLGKVTKVDFNNGARVQEWDYNGVDQVYWENHPETGEIWYQYSPEGQLVLKDWDTTRQYYEYNEANQLALTSYGYYGYPPEETITYQYHINGTLEGLYGSQGWSRSGITYNELGSQLTAALTIPDLGIKSYSYTYDGSNHLESVTYPSGRMVAYTGNGLGLPETVDFYDGSGTVSLVSAVDYGYGKQATSVAYGNDTTMTATYNEAGLVDFIELVSGSSESIYRTRYDYNGVGNIERLWDTLPVLDADFGYDNLHRLVLADYLGPSGKSFGYYYDDYGNMDWAAQESTPVADYSYNSKNQITNSGYSYDARGNLTSDPDSSYTWDTQNRLEQVVHPVSGAPMLTSSYDERGLRMKATRRLPFVPDGGELWKVGETRDIEWKPSATSGGTVKIEYSTDGGSSWRSVDQAKTTTDDDGLFEWTIPQILGPSSSSLVRVSTLADEALYQSYSGFTIDAPVITVTAPGDGDAWEVGSTYDITWVSSPDVVGDVEIDYTVDGVSWLPISAGTENDGSYSWLIPSTPATDCQVRVREADDYPEGISEPFDILEEPVITVTRPTEGTKYYATSTCTICNRISWTSSGSVGNVMIEYSPDSGSHWNLIVASTENDGSYDDWVPPNTPSTTCLVRISDVDGHPTGVTPAEFEIKEPELVVTYPVGGETFYVGQHQFVTWDITTQDYVPPVDITVIKDGEKYCAYTIRPTHVTDEIVSFFISLCVGTDLKIRIATNAAYYESAGTLDIVWPYLADFTVIDGGDATTEINNSYMAEWGDYDADNDLDLVVVEDGATNIYRNDCNPTCTLTKVFTIAKTYTSAAWGDYDNDNLLDLYLTKSGTNILYRNLGADQFERIAKIPPVKDRADSNHSQWVDYDNDGNLDLFVANSGDENFLYRNLGGGSFVKIGNQELVEEVTDSYFSAWADYDDDGDLDVFIANDGANRLYRNLHAEGSSGSFSRITADGIETDSLISYSATWGDFDDDGDLDVIIPNRLSDHSLLINDGNHQFRRYSDVDASNSPLSVMLRTTATGSADLVYFFSSADFDNDGDDDVIRTLNDPANAFSNTLFKNVGDPYFILSSTFYDPAPFRDSPGYTSHAAWGDFDNDGDLDLYLTQVGGSNWLYQNNLTQAKGSVVAEPDHGEALAGDLRSKQTVATDNHPHPRLASSRAGATIDTSLLPLLPHDGWSSGRGFGPTLATGTTGLAIDPGRVVFAGSVASERSSSRTYQPDNDFFPVPEISWREPRRQMDREVVELLPEPRRESAGLRSKSGIPVGVTETYYLYSNDGVLMAEYDGNGDCTKEYLYLGRRLLAEYDPQASRYYYYTNDQISSTRLTVDDTGNVAYSAAYGPFGEPLVTWVNSHDPDLKFSGKEREEHTGHDYFGARYYDYFSYRFTSVDPVINKKEAMDNPQLWNLYSYCNNNPITVMDPDGRNPAATIGPALKVIWKIGRAIFWAKRVAKLGENYVKFRQERRKESDDDSDSGSRDYHAGGGGSSGSWDSAHQQMRDLFGRWLLARPGGVTTEDYYYWMKSFDAGYYSLQISEINSMDGAIDELEKRQSVYEKVRDEVVAHAKFVKENAWQIFRVIIGAKGVFKMKK